MTLPRDELDGFVEKYRSIVEASERGRKEMAWQTALICGLARDLEPLTNTTLRRIDSLAAEFKQAAVVLYENDSHDGTAAKLQTWAAERHGRGLPTHVTTETHNKPRHAHTFAVPRIQDMAYYRARLHARTVDMRNRCGFVPDYVVLLDTDYYAGWSWRGLESCFARDDWDVLFANGIRFAPEPRPPWRIRVRMFDTAAFRDANDTIDLAPGAPKPDAPLMPAVSGFGGVAIYRWDAWASGSYLPEDGERAAKSCECEHVGFHRRLRANGFTRTYIAPPLLACHGRTPGASVELLWVGSVPKK